MDPTPEKPFYSKVYSGMDGNSKLYSIKCDEGVRQLFVCREMYSGDANWLIKQIQGKPFNKRRTKVTNE